MYEDTGIRVKLQPIVCVKLGEEQFAEADDKALCARMNFKRSVTKIIIKLQAYKQNQIIINTQKSRQRLSKIVPLMPELETNDLSAYGNSYFTEEEMESSHQDNDSQLSNFDADHIKDEVRRVDGFVQQLERQELGENSPRLQVRRGTTKEKHGKS